MCWLMSCVVRILGLMWWCLVWWLLSCFLMVRVLSRLIRLLGWCCWSVLVSWMRLLWWCFFLLGWMGFGLIFRCCGLMVVLFELCGCGMKKLV